MPQKSLLKPFFKDFFISLWKNGEFSPQLFQTAHGHKGYLRSKKRKLELSMNSKAEKESSKTQCNGVC